MDYPIQTYIFGIVDAMQKETGFPVELGRNRNLLEYKTLILKVPRRVGKSYLIQGLALQETNPIIYVRSTQMIGNYPKILHKYVRFPHTPRYLDDREATALFFDEIPSNSRITEIIEDTARNSPNIKYALALYT